MGMTDQLHETPATPQDSDLNDVLEVVGQLQERVDELEGERERADRLEDTLESERRRRRGLEKRLAQIDRDQKSAHNAIQIKTDAMNDRIAALEDQSVDAGDVIDAAPAEVLLPIQNLYNTVKAGGEDSLKANEARAAKVWPHFRDYADPSGGRLTLSSPKVRDVLEQEVGEDNADSMTVKRVMGFLARYSGRDDDSQIITMNTDTHPNQLECDRDDWLEATNEMMEVAKRNGASEAVADGGREGGEK